MGLRPHSCIRAWWLCPIPESGDSVGMLTTWGGAGAQLAEGAHFVPTPSSTAPWHGCAELRISPGAGSARHFNSMFAFYQGEEASSQEY